MLYVFRKIRQNLMLNGETGKVLKYAVLEMVMVVVGILLALYINNINESNKQLEYEGKIITKMIQQTVADSVLFNTRMQNLEKSHELYSYE